MIRVMTYNIANGVATPERLLPVLLAAEVDVIALQEVAPSQAGALASGLADRYPQQAIYPLGIPGKAIFSRLPMAEIELLEFAPGRPDLWAVVASEDGPVHIIAAHPAPPRIKRGGTIETVTRNQLTQLIAHATRGVPTVMMGDFNAVAGQPVYRRLARAGLIDAYKQGGAGVGVTLPTRMAKFATTGNRIGDVQIKPFLRVDYIWHTSHFRTLRAWVGAHGGSDHLPVIAELDWLGKESAEAEALVAVEGIAQDDRVRRIWTKVRR